MADKVEVAITPTAFTIALGDTTEATVNLRNLGQTVDQFTISIDGIDPSWYTLPVSSVALFPNDQDNLRIILHPPRSTTIKAGSYPFRINVASQENPEEKATTDLAIEIRALAELEISISPQSITGRRGLYQIAVKNPDDSETILHLEANDAEGILRYSLQPESLKVPGGGWAASTLEVRLGWMAFFGGEKQFDFQVMAKLPDVEEAKTVNGQLLRLPWYRILTRIRLYRIRPAISRTKSAISRIRLFISRIKIPWLSRPPAISNFKANTEDKREFTLSWSVKRAKMVMINDEEVDKQDERLVSPTEPTTYVLTASNKYGSSSRTVDVHPLPKPEARASERIRVSLSPSQLPVQAGVTPVSATLQVQNLGEIVDKLSVEIEGLDETWYSRSASSIALMPQASDQVQITFQPPKKKGVKARTYPFAITVRSQSNTEEATSVLGQLEVLPLVESKIEVRPYRVTCRKKGTFRINVANIGVSDARFILDATDLDEGLDFRFKNDTPEVTAWSTVEVPMIARPKRRSTVGEKKRYDITVTANAGEGRSQSVNCELHHHPFIGSWKPVLRIVRALVVLAAIGVLIYFVLKWGGGWSQLTRSPQTWVNNLIHTFEGWFRR